MPLEKLLWRCGVRAKNEEYNKKMELKALNKGLMYKI